MKSLRIILVSCMIACIFASCKKENVAPALPPEGSMVMKFDGFWSGTPKSVSVPKSNFLYASLNVSWWNLVLTVQLSIPVATFIESFNHQPVWDGGLDVWIWSYQVPVGSDIFTAELHGKDNGDEVNWNMYISKTGGFTDFLWYSGVSRKDNTSGTWYLNKAPENPTDYLQIDWNNNSDETADIRYQNVIPGANENGSYIKYGIVGDLPLNSYYDIFGHTDSRLINIKWNSTSHAGRVMDQKYFTDSNWHCWDELFINTNCQ
ncbi:MAG: hypothetical protein NTV01_02915 [Bacteroidia bacterium]|nr:hypothetical protein [Bacteroidia bacterium]